jgi:hypothetical protein
VETETVFFAKLCVRLGDLCGFALSSSLNAKYAKGFRKERKATCTSTQRRKVSRGQSMSENKETVKKYSPLPSRHFASPDRRKNL